MNIADFWECLFLNQLMLKFLFLTDIYIFQNVYKSIIFIKTVVTSSAGGDLLELPRVRYFGTDAIFNSWTDFPHPPRTTKVQHADVSKGQSNHGHEPKDQLYTCVYNIYIYVYIYITWKVDGATRFIMAPYESTFWEWRSPSTFTTV